MIFTCIKCEWKYSDSQMDMDERICFECLDKEEDTDDD